MPMFFGKLSNALARRTATIFFRKLPQARRNQFLNSKNNKHKTTGKNPNEAASIVLQNNWLIVSSGDRL